MKRIETNLDMSQIGTNNNILFFWDMLNSTILLYKRRKKLKFEAEIGEKLRSIGKKHKKSDMVAFWFCSSGEELYATIITLLSIFQKMICSKDMRGEYRKRFSSTI